jgi:hypothetical protein
LGDPIGQKKKLWHSNQGIVPANKKIEAQQSGGCASQKKNCGAQLGDRTGRKMDLGAAIRGSSQFESKLWRGNREIVPAK